MTSSTHRTQRGAAPKGGLLLLAMAIAGVAALWLLGGGAFFDAGKELTLEEARETPNPVPDSPEVLAEAKNLYVENCEHCHGETGAGDGGEAMMYDPPPADFTREGMRNIRDGELFYKISEGRKPMPSFRRLLTEEQRWKLVRLIRTFAIKKEE